MRAKMEAFAKKVQHQRADDERKVREHAQLQAHEERLAKEDTEMIVKEKDEQINILNAELKLLKDKQEEPVDEMQVTMNTMARLMKRAREEQEHTTTNKMQKVM